MAIKKHEEALDRLLAPYKLEGDFKEVLEVQGRALDGVQVDVDYLEGEIIPDKADDEETLSRWENLLGLPTPSGINNDARRAQILAKLVATGGLSKPYFESLALALGYSVLFIDPPRFFRAGVSRANDPVFDPLEDFRALANDGSTVGGLVASEDRSDEFLHYKHNDENINLRVYDEGETPRQWAFGVEIYGETRGSSDLLIKKLLELKPVGTFVKWNIFQGEPLLGGDGETLIGGDGAELVGA